MPVTESATRVLMEPTAVAAVAISTFDRREESSRFTNSEYNRRDRPARADNFRRILLSQFGHPDYMPATCNLHRRG